MRLITTTAILALAAGPTFAGGLGEPEIAQAPATPAPVYTPTGWAGGYVGAQLGYGWADAGGTDADGATLG